MEKPIREEWKKLWKFRITRIALVISIIFALIIDIVLVLTDKNLNFFFSIVLNTLASVLIGGVLFIIIAFIAFGIQEKRRK